MREIIPQRLWIGNAGDARNVPALMTLGVQAVVDLAQEEPPCQLPRDIAYCRIPLNDGNGNIQAFLQAAIDVVMRFHRGNVPLLVACSGGMSRSPAVAAAALSLIEGTSADVMLTRITADQPCDLSPGLWSELEAVIRSYIEEDLGRHS